MTNSFQTAITIMSVSNAPPFESVSHAIAAEMSNSKEFLQVAIDWLNTNGISFIVNLFVTLLILIFGAYLIRQLKRATQRALNRTRRINNLLENFLCSVVSKTAWVLLFMIVLQRLGVNIAPLIAGLGITGFILGFGFQESLSNLAAGMMIAINHPFKVGDFVSIGGIDGAVRELNMMAATLTTADNKQVVIPNKLIWGAPITNYTATDKRRLEIAISIAYGEDIGKAKRIAMEVIKANPLVLLDPEPIAEVLSLGNSAINLVLRPWTTPADYWLVFFALNQSVKEAFDKHNIEIPFPQLDVRMKNS